MDEVDYYDEFGNYIGPSPSNNSDNSIRSSNEEFETVNNNDIHFDIEMDRNDIVPFVSNSQVILNEDKKYFPSASEIYGDTVQVLVEEEDAQPLTEPIIAPIKEIIFDTVVSDIKMKYSLE